MSASSGPLASRRPFERVTHGHTRIDDWEWLEHKDDPEVIAHLKAENTHTDAVMANTEQLQQDLYDEIVGRVLETDLSVPVRSKGWWYFNRTEEGKQYSTHCRRRDGQDVEEIIFDENVEAGNGYFALGIFDISPDGMRLAYGVDRSGQELYQLRFRDLETGRDLDDVIEPVSYGSAWSKNNEVLFYTRADDTQRPYQVWRHVIGTDPAADTLMFEENDQQFWVGVGASKSEDYVMIVTSSSLTSETLLLKADEPMREFRVVEPRRENIRYHLIHHKNPLGEQFFVLSNERAPNFKLVTAPIDAPQQANWREFIAHRDDVKLDDVDEFANHLVLGERADATVRIAVLDLRTNERHIIEQSETEYSAGARGNPEFDTDTLRFGYTSMVTPSCIYDYDMNTRKRTLLKQQPVLGDFDAGNYEARREYATAQDGTTVPISIVQRKDRADPPGPTLLYGYGSYEISIDPTFSSARLSLLDRGFTFAIAHIRGGGDLGRLWYEQAKFLTKKTTFTDFVTCAKHLVDNGYTTPEQLVIRGGSAGGMLMGASLNMAPGLFGAVVAQVPFVDVLNTMLDATLPLTVNEYEEWGNPNDPEYYRYMLSYSPYDNIEDNEFPHVLAMAGLNDPRVRYCEAAKWVQKLRAHNNGNSHIVLKTEMGSGHGGPSGRYEAWKEEAFVQAFILQAVARAET